MVHPIRVSLDRCEYLIVCAVADFRVDRVIRERLGPGHGEKGRDRDMLYRRHWPGAMAELAHAKHWDIFWAGKSSDFGREGDVHGVEVRGTGTRSGHLIIFPRDPDDRLCVLGACQGESVVWLCGGMFAGQAKLSKYDAPPEKLRPGSPKQFWVPQSDLVPLSAIVEHQPAFLEARTDLARIRQADLWSPA